jgi:iron complex outermembrane receptor protein
VFIALRGSTPVDVAGNPLQFAPNWKLAFAGRYEIPIREYGSLMLGGNLTWTDDQYFDHFKDPRHSQEAYTLVNAFARFKTWDEHWSFEIYGKNLAEEEYLQTTLDVIGDVYGYLGAPRTFGFQAIYRY